MNRLQFALYKFLRVLPLGLVAVAVPAIAPAAQAEVKTPEEIACEIALRKNTIEALEDFLARYPRADTACNALALDALQNFGPETKKGGGSGTGAGPGGGGYGS